MRVVETRKLRKSLAVNDTEFDVHNIILPITADNTAIYVRIDSIIVHSLRQLAAYSTGTITDKFEMYASGCYSPIPESTSLQELSNVINSSVMKVSRDVYAISNRVDTLSGDVYKQVSLSSETINTNLASNDISALIRGDVNNGNATFKLITDSTLSASCIIEVNYSRMSLTQQETQALLERLPGCCC